MHVFTDIPTYLAYRKSLSMADTVGFVPTMGNLHQGHASLVTQSLQKNSITVVSLFVNPTQFNDQADFDHYPRTIQADIAYLTELGVTACFIPQVDAMYPNGMTFSIHETTEDHRLEGLSRPGHFSGMLTIVLKLLTIIQPDTVYLGDKDYQQCLLIKGMIKAFFLPIEVTVCPTIREPSGLPLSSRNSRLSTEERQLADHFAAIFHTGTDCTTIKQNLETLGIRVDYIAESDHQRFAAVFIGNVRLIDHVHLT